MAHFGYVFLDDLFESQVASCIYSNSLNVAIVTHDGTNDDETLSQELRDVLNRHKVRLLHVDHLFIRINYFVVRTKVNIINLLSLF